MENSKGARNIDKIKNHENQHPQKNGEIKFDYKPDITSFVKKIVLIEKGKRFSDNKNKQKPITFVLFIKTKEYKKPE